MLNTTLFNLRWVICSNLVPRLCLSSAPFVREGENWNELACVQRRVQMLVLAHAQYNLCHKTYYSLTLIPWLRNTNFMSVFWEDAGSQESGEWG